MPVVDLERIQALVSEMPNHRDIIDFCLDLLDEWHKKNKGYPAMDVCEALGVNEPCGCKVCMVSSAIIKRS